MILVVGLPLLLGWRNSDEPVVTVTTVPPGSTSVASSAPSTSPGPSGDSGTLQTSIGELAWQHLTSDGSDLPDRTPLETPTGFISVSVDNIPTDAGDFDDPVFWRSSDGYAWTSGPLPVAAAGSFVTLKEVGGTYWITTSDYTTAANLWQSDDGESWSEVQLPDGIDLGFSLIDVDGVPWLTDNTGRIWTVDGSSWAPLDIGLVGPAAITGLDSMTSIQTPVTLNGVTLVPWSLGGVGLNYGALLGTSDSVYPEYDPETGILTVPSQDGSAPLATWTVTVEGNQVCLTDETGAVVHEIVVHDERIDATTLMGNRYFDQFLFSGLGVIDSSGQVVDAEPPWKGPIEPISPAQVVAFDGRFLAFVNHAAYDDPQALGSTSREVEVWTSTDGLNWEGPTGFLPDGDQYYVLSVRGRRRPPPRRHRWLSRAQDSGYRKTASTGLRRDWSTNGRCWSKTSQSLPDSAACTSHRTWPNWTAVDISEIGFDLASANGIGIGEAGGLIFLTAEQGGPPSDDMWVLRPSG